jgi:cytochrome c
VNTRLLALSLAFASAPLCAGVPADEAAMIELAWDSGCFTCHDLREPLRGPAWSEIAERYRGDEGAFERLVATVISGGSGNWGDDVMSPNRRVPERDVRILVEWLLTLDSSQNPGGPE